MLDGAHAENEEMATVLVSVGRGPQPLVSILRATQPPRRVFNLVHDMVIGFIAVLEAPQVGCH
jgi:hypothetical protein